MGIYSLPAYLLEYRDKAVLVRYLVGYNDFANVIAQLTDGSIKPKKTEKTLENIMTMIDKHPLISPIEIREAFDFDNIGEVKDFIKPLVEGGKISLIYVYHGWFIKKLEK